MSPEREKNFVDNIRGPLRVVSFGLLGVGAVLTAFPATFAVGTTMVGAGLGDLGLDYAFGDSVSKGWDKVRGKKK